MKFLNPDVENECYAVRHFGEIPEIALYSALHYLTKAEENPRLAVPTTFCAAFFAELFAMDTEKKYVRRFAIEFAGSFWYDWRQFFRWPWLSLFQNGCQQ